MDLVADVSDEEIRSLTNSILVRYGLDFTCYEPKSLKRRIVRILNLFNLTSVHELWVKFLRDQNFVHTFMNELSVGMTSMFRDPILWKSLKRIVNHYQKNQTIKIWHSGCSTGEEVFSMGILLRELKMQEKSTAYCTDINLVAMDEAQQGVYHKIKMIENERNYKEYNIYGDFSKYYQAQSTTVQMDISLINHATFAYQNLITDTFSSGFDIIFCRNVMIYFDNAAKTKLLDKFYKALNPGGLFIIGFFDTMGYLMDDRHFKMIDEQAKIFQKIN